MGLNTSNDTLEVDIGGLLTPGTIPASALGSMAEFTLFNTAVPFILPSTGSMGNNGAISSLTALPLTYASAYMYFTAGQIAAASAAGWYYVVMSSTTAGTVYNNTYTSGQPVIPASPTAFATTGPGAFTGDTSAQAAVTFTVPALTMGIRDTLRTTLKLSETNNSNAKGWTLTFGGSVAGGAISGITSVLSDITFIDISNRDNSGVQICGSTSANLGGTGAGIQQIAIDTTSNQSLAVNLQHGTATDNVILEGILVELLRGS